MVLNLVEPQSSGIGGGAFLMHFTAKGGKIEAYDGREWAPASAKPEMFLAADGKARRFQDVRPGGLSVGVPGVLRMLEQAHREHGKLPWAELFKAAIDMADDGFVVSPRLAESIADAKDFNGLPGAKAYFLTADGKPKAAGTRLANHELAGALRAIAAGGADAFYKGDIAKDIIRVVGESSVNPAKMTEADFSDYQAKKREPVCSFYRVWLVCGMPAPSSGGISTLQILGMLQRFDLDKDKEKLGPGTPLAIHLVAEASKIAFADRNTYIADPDFIPVPAAGMLDPGYLSLRSSEISTTKSMGRAEPGMPGIAANRVVPGPDDGDGGLSTSHISIVDADGNAVSLTTSIESAFGSRLMVRGFLLNNQLTDFTLEPTFRGATVANRAEPHKRPRSSMAPTLVLDGSGKLVLTLGSPGGPQIIGYVTKTLVAALDWKMNIQQAIAYPIFLNRNGATEIEDGTPLARIKPALEALGQTVELKDFDSGLQGIKVLPDVLTGGADPRREGAALGN
jgi:gamma-glutamyltranspeptidase/glutathione hydrolase